MPLDYQPGFALNVCPDTQALSASCPAVFLTSRLWMTEDGFQGNMDQVRLLVAAAFAEILASTWVEPDKQGY